MVVVERASETVGLSCRHVHRKWPGMRELNTSFVRVLNILILLYAPKVCNPVGVTIFSGPPNGTDIHIFHIAFGIGGQSS